MNLEKSKILKRFKTHYFHYIINSQKEKNSFSVLRRNKNTYNIYKDILVLFFFLLINVKMTTPRRPIFAAISLEKL